MSRSIHTTHRDVRHWPKRWFSDPPDESFANLRRKHRIKSQVLDARRSGTSEAAPPMDPATISVIVEDEGPHLFYPARPDDVRAVLAALPPYTVDGLRRVRMQLGLQDQEKPCLREGCRPQRDPVVGRLGFERRKGLFEPHYHGMYGNDTIYLYPFVVDPSQLPTGTELHDLLEECLEFLLHEVAHHFDWPRRVSRGRWLHDDAEKAEVFAEKQARRWMQEVGLPYVAAAYPGREVDRRS